MAGEDRMSRPDEGLIHAWLDGELSPDEAARVASLSEQDPEWREAVAEARGLIAASSRIVRALDAVPGGVVPARVPVARKPYRVRPWVGIAAGLVFVAGTTYVMRDTTETVFRPTLPTSSDVAPTSTPASTPTPPPSDTVPLSAPAPLIDSASRRLRRAAEELREQAKVTAEPAAARVADRTAEQTAAAQRSRADADRIGARAARPAALAEMGAASPPPPRVLEGCWLASAPEALARLHRDLVIIRVVGDSLALQITATETVLVVRDGDTLRGGLTARRTECPETT
jgi:hypothetical protein